MAGSGLPAGVPEKEIPPSYPGDVTYYFPINLGGATGYGKGSATGVFFPKGYGYPSTIDVILFFHGNKQSWNTIQDYWKPGNSHFIALREAINEAGKQVVLIAPTMGGYPGQSGNMTGTLDEHGKSADDLLDDAMLYMSLWMPQYKGKATPKVGKVVLSAHSGGGETLLRQTMLMSKYAANIRACWGFDCTYGWAATSPNVDNWIKWARFHGNVDNRFYYQKGTAGVAGADTETVATGIKKIAEGAAPLPGGGPKDKPVYQKLGNVRVHGSSIEHYNQMNDNFPDLVDAL